MRIPYPFLALLGLSVAVGAEANLVLTPSLARPALSTPAAAPPSSTARSASWATDAWWQGFEDETLDELVLAARQRSGAAAGVAAVAGDTLALPLEMQVAATYVSARVDSIGLELIREAQAAARSEASLMTEDVLSDADRAVLGRRLADARSAERTLADRRGASIALLAWHCGMSTATVEALVAPAPGAQRLPQFAGSVPATEHDRDDIEGTDDDEGVYGGVSRAEAQVSAALYELQDQQQKTAALGARAAEMGRILEDTLARQKEGSASELEVLEHYQQLMLYSQQFVSATGTLALGWIKLVYRLQGAIDRAAPASEAPAVLWPTTTRRRLV